MIKLQQVCVEVDHKMLLTHIDLALGKGLMVGLIGPNGAGKTTLLKVLANLVKPLTGEYHLFGVEHHALSSSELSKKLGYMPQSSTIAWPISVQQIVELGRIPYRRFLTGLSKEDHAAVQLAMELTETTVLKHRIAHTLSGGEQTRALLARVLAAEPELILADEPIASLDPYHQLHVLEIFRERSQQGATVIISLHDLNYALRFCDIVLLMQSGQLIAHGAPEDIITPEYMASVYRIQIEWLYSQTNKVLLPTARI